MDSELIRGRASKLLLEVAIDLGLNLIVKTSILYRLIENHRNRILRIF